jgi:2-oxoisovalerate dehydrogenase E1 component
MPKNLAIDPRKMRERGVLEPPAIPLNVYAPDAQRELAQWGADGLRAVYSDMLLIREFETMLGAIKIQGVHRGIEYSHRGPAHLAIGQEAAIVGLCLPLQAADLIFGSHRSHAEILAKCMRAIRDSDDERLQQVMAAHLNGDTLRVAERLGPGANSAAALARVFIVYGLLAEIFGRTTGVNRGLGGSMHAFFAPFGSMPNNAIVGASCAIAVGAALFKRINGRDGIVIANIGDSAAASGPTWESMNLASMDQYRTLWDPEIGGAPPVMFSFINNFYGMGSQTVGETLGFDVLARIGAAVNPDAMHAERVDGYNPLSVAAAVAAKRELLLAGQGPVLLDTVTYRFAGHSPSDPGTYRTKEEIAEWQAVDGLLGYRQYLIENGLATGTELDAEQEQTAALLEDVLRAAVSTELSPQLQPQSQLIDEVMFSGQTRPALAAGTPQLTGDGTGNQRLAAIAKRSRAGVAGDGSLLAPAQTVTIRDALFEALLHRFREDPTFVAYGEENRDWGGAFAVYRGLTELLPYHRLFNTPIAEAAIVGSAVGYALSGGRAVVELMYCDFLGRAGDEVFNQMAKWQSMSAGVLELPVVLRISVGNQYGAQHAQDWSALFAHIPGLKVYFPVTPYDAKGMLNFALTRTDPVIFLESQQLYDRGEQFEPAGVPPGYYEVAEGQPVVRRAGGDITIITLGAVLYRALDAADRLQAEYGVNAEVIDARFINPLDYAPLIASVEKTGRVLLCSDAVDRGNFLHTVASKLTQACFDSLDAPPLVLGARNWITPAVEYEAMFFPQPEWILDAIHEELLPLPGHSAVTVHGADEHVRRSLRGT